MNLLVEQLCCPVSCCFLLGIIICMAQIPESIAFAYLARVRPPVALHAAWVIGGVCSALGGRPGMVRTFSRTLGGAEEALESVCTLSLTALCALP